MTPLLRNRNFLWFWAGEGISQLGAQFTGLALPVLAVTLLGASEWEVGVLGAAQTAAFLVRNLGRGVRGRRADLGRIRRVRGEGNEFGCVYSHSPSVLKVRRKGAAAGSPAPRLIECGS